MQQGVKGWAARWLGTGCFSIHFSSGNQPLKKISCWAALHGHLPSPWQKPMLEWTKGKQTINEWIWWEQDWKTFSFATLRNVVLQTSQSLELCSIWRAWSIVNEIIWVKNMFESVLFHLFFLTFWCFVFFCFFFLIFCLSQLHHIS